MNGTPVTAPVVVRRPAYQRYGFALTYLGVFLASASLVAAALAVVPLP